MPSSGEGTRQTENSVRKPPEAEHAQQRARSEAEQAGQDRPVSGHRGPHGPLRGLSCLLCVSEKQERLLSKAVAF